MASPECRGPRVDASLAYSPVTAYAWRPHSSAWKGTPSNALPSMARRMSNSACDTYRGQVDRKPSTINNGLVAGHGPCTALNGRVRTIDNGHTHARTHPVEMVGKLGRLAEVAHDGKARAFVLFMHARGAVACVRACAGGLVARAVASTSLAHGARTRMP